MADDEQRKPDLDQDDNQDVEERVRRMMDPALKDEPETPDESQREEPAPPATAPELVGLPVPKEPLKIKILAEGESPKPTIAQQAASLKKTTEELPKGLGEDAATAKAVDDIVAHEGDELLEIEDQKAAALQPPKHHGLKQKIKHFFKAWWHNPKVRWATVILLLLLIAASATIPRSRYFVLNTMGVRGSLSVQVLDDSTLQPLKNVEVRVSGVSALTNTEGHAKLEKVKLGQTELVIEKRAFAPSKRTITVGWGSNPQGEVSLTPVGAQYTFALTDFLSGKGVRKVEAISGEASALSDENGHIKLTLDEPMDEFEVLITGQGYREEKLKVSASAKDELPVQLVPGRKHVFVSKRSGNLDVYKIDIDGKNEEKILPSTGTEREDMALISHPKDEIVAVVSTRENKRNSDGFLLSTLMLIDLEDNSTKALVTSERVQLVDWIGDRLIYVRVVAGTSATNPKRHRLISYDYKTGHEEEIAASNYFNDVLVAANKLYYAPSGVHQDGVNVSLFQISADGHARQVLVSKETWNLFRTAYDLILVAAVDKEWYEYRLGDQKAVKITTEPPNLTSRVYVDDPAGKNSLWVDERDGKGVLLAYDITKKEDKILHTESGLKLPTRWLNSHTVIYRIKTEQQTADYAISVDASEPKKIRDVTNTGGVGQWYYY